MSTSRRRLSRLFCETLCILVNDRSSVFLVTQTLECFRVDVKDHPSETTGVHTVDRLAYEIISRLVPPDSLRPRELTVRFPITRKREWSNSMGKTNSHLYGPIIKIN